MRIADDVTLIPVTFEGPLATMVMNLSVVRDADGASNLIDAAMPGCVDAVEAALDQAGFSLSDLQRVIVTHHDIDHIGSLHGVAAVCGANIVTHFDEAEYVCGAKRMVKYPSDEVLAQDPVRKRMFEQIGFAAADQTVVDGDLIGGTIRVIATPGRSPGHIALFVESSRVLITGDALTSQDGVLMGPNQRATPDMSLAIQSVQRLAQLDDVRAIITYHGGLVSDDPTEQLRRVARELLTSD